jgi:hypothetical protein
VIDKGYRLTEPKDQGLDWMELESMAKEFNNTHY